jgi:hypothetical protein
LNPFVDVVSSGLTKACVENTRKEMVKIHDDEDLLSLLDTFFWMMVGFDYMMCSGFF